MDNKAKVESHKGWNKIAIQHLDKLGKEQLFRRFADNIVAVVVDIEEVVDIAVVADIVVEDKRGLGHLVVEYYHPSLLELADKSNLALFFVDPSLAKNPDQSQLNYTKFHYHIYHGRNLINL